MRPLQHHSAEDFSMNSKAITISQSFRKHGGSRSKSGGIVTLLEEAGRPTISFLHATISAAIQQAFCRSLSQVDIARRNLETPSCWPTEPKLWRLTFPTNKYPNSFTGMLHIGLCIVSNGEILQYGNGSYQSCKTKRLKPWFLIKFIFLVAKCTEKCDSGVSFYLIIIPALGQR